MPPHAVWRRAFVLAALAVAPGHGRAFPEDLMELYVKAVEFDPEFQRARLQRQVAEEGLKESRGALLPEFRASSEASHENQDIRESASPLFTPGRSQFYNTAYSVSLSQPIYHLDVLARVPQARAEVRQAEASFVAAEQELIFRLAQAYFEYLAAQDRLDLASAERQAIGEQLREAEERFESGLVTIADVQDLRGRFAVAQAEEIEAEFLLDDARQAFAIITGQEPDEIPGLSESYPLVHPGHEDAGPWVASALFQNPRLQALEASIEMAEQEIRRQRGAYMPGLDLVASFSHTDSGGTIFGEGNEIQNREVGLRLAVPLFDGRTSARVQAAALRRGSAVQEMEKERRRVEREVRSSYQGVVSGIHLVEAHDKAVYAHQAALLVKEEGWRAGVNTGLIVLDARKELFEARRDLARSRYLYVLSSFRLKQAVGILGIQDLRQINEYLQ